MSTEDATGRLTATDAKTTVCAQPERKEKELALYEAVMY
jgi:hypothetical protein